MDFKYDEQQQAINDLAEQILSDRATPEELRERDLAAGPWLDQETWQLLGTSGLLAVALPESVGGGGGRFTDMGVLIEVSARHAAPLPVVECLVLGALPVARFGTAEQQKRLLPGVLAGERFLTAALQEPHGADPRTVTQVTAEPGDAGAWVLNGAKTLVPLADRAERIVVMAVTPHGLGAFLVAPDAAGVRRTPQETVARKPNFLLSLDAVTVPAADVLAQPGSGEAVLDWLLDRATTAVCLAQLGSTEALLSLAASYVTEREQFGRPIGTFQAVAHSLADAFIDTEAIRLTAWHAAWLLDREETVRREVAIAKWWAAEGGVRAMRSALHVHGGIGVDLDYPAHRHYLAGRWQALCLGGAAYQLDTLGALLAA